MTDDVLVSSADGKTPDEDLWARAGQSPADAGAFGQLYERHADDVYNHCFRRTGSWEAAEDLTSTVFMDAWRRRGEVVFIGESLLPWLLGVANNAIRNQARSARRQRRLLLKLPPQDITPDLSDEAAARIDSEARMRHVLVAFEQLSSDEQDVLSLCGWARLDYAQAAELLRIPVGTVRSRLSRARQKLLKDPPGDAANPAEGRAAASQLRT